MKNEILFITPVMSSFVERDISLLNSDNNKVYINIFKIIKKRDAILQIFKQLIFLPFKLVNKSIIICRFLGYHSLIPAFYGKIFSKPVLAILGGTECHYFPSIKYGNYSKWPYSLFTKLSFKLVTHLAPVDESLVLTDYFYDDKDFPKQGFKFFNPGINTPYTVIHNGYDSGKFYNLEKIRVKNSFLTVALSINGNLFYLKGIDLIFGAAKNFPDFKFTIIAQHNNIPDRNIPQNVNLISGVSYSDLLNFYNDHEYYLQLSMAEGFPNALCEAMLCGCIPIGSNVFSIPKIIGDSGYILKYKDISGFNNLLDKAVTCNKRKLRMEARNQIINNYNISIRRIKLTRLVKEILLSNKTLDLN